MVTARKKLALLLALVLCLSLAACGEKTEKPQQPTSPTGTVAGPTTGTPGTTGTVPSTTTGLTAEDIDLPADGWSAPDIGLMYTGAYGAGGYYSEYDSMLIFTDLSNGASVVLCSKPGCRHYDEPTPKAREECDAYIGVLYCIHYQNDKIYYVALDLGSDDNLPWLMCRNADGTGERKIGRLGSEYINKETSMVATQYVFAGDMLYYRADVSNLIQTENGVMAEQATWLLMRMELSTGKEELLEEYKLNEAPHLQGAREDMLLYCTIQMLTEEEQNADPSLVWEKSAKLKVWIESAGQSVTLFSYKNKEFQGGGHISAGKYYYPLYKDNEEVTVAQKSRCYVYDLVTRQNEDTGLRNVPTLNGRYAIYYDEDISNQYLYDIEADERLQMEYTNVRIEILTVGPEGAVLRINQYSDNESGKWSIVSTEYRYIRFAELEDGLQKTDGILMTLM